MTYEYRCKCGWKFEMSQSIDDPPRAVCPKCKEYTKARLINIPSVLTKNLEETIERMQQAGIGYQE